MLKKKRNSSRRGVSCCEIQIRITVLNIRAINYLKKKILYTILTLNTLLLLFFYIMCFFSNVFL